MSAAKAANPASTPASPASRTLRERLALERVLPHPRLVQLCAHVAEVARAERGQLRVVGRAGPPLEHGARVVGPRGGEEEREVPRHVEEARRQRERLAPTSPGSPFPSQRANTNSSAASMPARARASPRTAARPRTSPRTTRGPLPDSRARPRPSARVPPGGGRPRRERGRRRSPGRGRPGRSGRRPPGARCPRRRGASPRARSTCSRRRGGARRSRCRRAPSADAPASSPRRTASTAVRSACSSGCPVPRSVASESAPISSAARIGWSTRGPADSAEPSAASMSGS